MFLTIYDSSIINMSQCIMHRRFFCCLSLILNLCDIVIELRSWILQIFHVLNNQIFVLTLKERLKCFVSYRIDLILNNFTSNARFAQSSFLTKNNKWSVNDRKTWTSINWMFKFFKSTSVMMTTNHSSMLISDTIKSMTSSSSLFLKNFESSWQKQTTNHLFNV